MSGAPRLTAATQVAAEREREQHDGQQHESPAQRALRERVGVGAQHGPLARRGEGARLERHRPMLDLRRALSDERPGDGQDAANARAMEPPSVFRPRERWASTISRARSAAAARSRLPCR